jgi:hypothetical protein
MVSVLWPLLGVCGHAQTTFYLFQKFLLFWEYVVCIEGSCKLYNSVFEMERSIWSCMYCASTLTSLALYPHASRDQINYGDRYIGNSGSELFISKCEHLIQKR